MPGDSIKPEADGAALVDAAASIRDVNRELDVDLPDGAWSTLAGWVLALAERMPAVGESFTLPNGVVLEVVETSQRRIRSVRVRRSPRGESAAPDGL